MPSYMLRVLRPREVTIFNKLGRFVIVGSFNCHLFDEGGFDWEGQHDFNRSLVEQWQAWILLNRIPV
jgi:hypothetical protein